MKYTVGVDIGGMSIKIGLVTDSGSILSYKKFKTPKNIDQAILEISNNVVELLNDHGLNLSEIKGIGIGCPGAVDRDTGEVIILPNLGWENEPLADKLKKHLDTKILLGNDVSVAALGEYKFGVAKGYDTAVMLAVGTGVGSGIIIDGKLYEGNCFRGGEIGHTTLVMDGLECTCGRKGCLEVYASATALIRQTKEEMLKNKDSKMWEYVGGDIEKVDGKTAFECSKQFDESANKVVSQYVTYLGEGMLNIFNVFRPQIFVLGGGICAQGDYLMDKLIDYCEKFDYGYKNSPKTEIKAAHLGNDAGIIGAAALID